MKMRFSQLAIEFPQALESLNKQLSMGSRLKTLVVRVLVELAEFGILSRVPILKDLLFTAKGLVSGHIAEMELVSSVQAANNLPTSTLVFQPIKFEEIIDVLIIGSGPGAVVATEIEREKGTKRIQIIERGSVPRTPHALHHSLTHVIRDFNQAGQELVIASGFPLYAQASVFGGGSEVNSGLYHDLPSQYVPQYSSAFCIAEEAWLDAERKTNKLLVPIEMKVSPDQSLLARGAGMNNLVVCNIPRWRTYLPDGSFQHRGMNEVYWSANHENSGVTLTDKMEVLKISTNRTDYLEVKCRNLNDGSISHIKAKRIHLAAGAISTPVILAKSGLINWRDTRFSWHPMIRVVATTKPGDLGAGDIDPFQAWTDNRTLKFGSAVSTAPLLSIALGRAVSVNESAHLRSYYASFSSSGRGGILPILGLPWYRFSKMDRTLAHDATELLKKVISDGGGEICNEDKVSSKKFSTVHIFGTLPINSEVYIPGTNQLKIDKRIRISDASILPFGPGVNPQGVVMTSVRIANTAGSDE